MNDLNLKWFKALGVYSKDGKMKHFDSVCLHASMGEKAESKVQWVKENHRKVCQMAFDQLSVNKTFQRFGLPVNVMKLSSVLIQNDGSMKFTFELKDELKGMLEQN